MNTLLPTVTVIHGRHMPSFRGPHHRVGCESLLASLTLCGMMVHTLLPDAPPPTGWKPLESGN